MTRLVRVPPGVKGDAALLLATTLVAAAMAFGYVSSERFFYFWDYAMYQDLTADTATAFRSSVGAGVRTVMQSMAGDYNGLFTLPLLPLSLGGDLSRRQFIVSLAVVYQVPFALAMGAVLSQVCLGRRRLVFWATVWVTLLMPTIWAPTLRGYPDAGGAALVLVAVWLHLRNAAEGSRLWRVALVGVAVGASILFRRHYSYAAVAFVAAVAIHDTVRVVGSGVTPSLVAPRMGRAVLEWAVLGTAITGTLLILGPAFAIHMLAHDYYQLYRSFLMSPAEEFGLFRDFFGRGFWLLSLGGWVVGWRYGAVSRTPAAFVFLFGAISLGLWVWVARQWGSHYGFHVVILLVPGLVAAGVVASERLRGTRGWARVACGAAAAVVVGLNLYLSWAPRPVRLLRPVRPWFAARYPPMIRADYAEMLRLLDYVRSIAGGDEAVYVGGSSETINFDILARADRTHRRSGGPDLNVLEVPQVDSRDWYPLEELLRAQVVVITTPFQRHLAPEAQDVVRMVDVAFTEGWEIARDFSPLPERFRLEGGAEVTVYRRTRPTEPAPALRLFAAERRFMQSEPPGRQPDWVSLTAETTTAHRPQEMLRVTLPSHGARPQRLLYTGQSDWSDQRLTASLRFPASLPESVRITLSTADEDNARGCTTVTAQVVSPDATGHALVSLATPTVQQGCPWLVLGVESVAGTTFPVELTELALRGPP